jgi:hypothetical protein
MGREAGMTETARAAIEQLRVESLRADRAEAQMAALREALTMVVDSFKVDEAAGYRSRDRQYAIEILGHALAQSQPDGPHTP